MSENKYPIGGYAPGKPEHDFVKGDFVTNGTITIIVIGRQGRDKTLFAGVIVEQNDPTDKVHKVGEYSESWHGWKFKKVEQPKPAGAVWVKANDRLPEHNKHVPIKVGNQFYGAFYNKDHKIIYSLLTHHFWGVKDLDVIMGVEWLDESAPAPNHDHITAALRKFVSMHEAGLLPNRFTYEEGKKALEGVGENNDAVEFAEWCDDNYYRKYGVWRHRGNHEHYTTADLHQLWQQSKSK